MMKTKYNHIILLLFCSFMACNNDSEMEISACGKKNPNWLIDEINQITGKTSYFRPVSIYSYISEKDDSEYIAITDNVNSSLTEALIFYLCTGEQIEASTDKYEELKELFKAKAFNLLWSN